MDYQIITKELLDELSAKAKDSERQRTNFNYHANFSDPINRMLNVMEPGTYARPHKHENPDKREVFIVIRGAIGVFFFNNDGEVTQALELSHASGNYAVEVAPGTWHSLVCLEKDTVLYEVKDGPYDVSNDKQFAAWAPDEKAPEAEAYVQFLLNCL